MGRQIRPAAFIATGTATAVFGLPAIIDWSHHLRRQP